MSEDYRIKLVSDKLKVYGPKMDGSYTITFEFGEYEKAKIAEIIREFSINENVVVELSHYESGHSLG